MDAAAPIPLSLSIDGWRRALALYTLAVEVEPSAMEPLLGRARAYAAIGMWCVLRAAIAAAGVFNDG